MQLLLREVAGVPDLSQKYGIINQPCVTHILQFFASFNSLILDIFLPHKLAV